MDRNELITHPQLAPRQIDLHRKVCTIRPGRIDVRPARSLVVLPAFGFLVGIGSALGIWFGMAALPIGVLIVLLLMTLILLPVSGMGVVYGIAGTNTIIDRGKQSATFQQGVFGLGLGTRELAPFWKITEFSVDEATGELAGDAPRDFVQYDLALVKSSGKRLVLGSVVVPKNMASQGLARARDAAEAMGALTERPVTLPEPMLLTADGRRRNKRRKGDPVTSPGARRNR